MLGSLGARDSAFSYQDQTDVTQLDWDGNVVWKFDHKEYIEDEGKEPMWMARQHHDYQREGNPVGYYVPGMESKTDGGNTLILCHETIHDHKISDKQLLNDVFIEVDWEGNIVWEWHVSDHFRAIIDKETGKIVWKLGPDFTETKESRKIGQIIGQHHVHMIPQGLPGEGNILIFDNGGWAGYGLPDRMSVDGTKVDKRDHSRVLEIDPTTLKVVWSYVGSDSEQGMMGLTNNTTFYSQLISAAQRLPNGNTLITEGCFCRLFEVTPEKEIVWEYRAPFDRLSRSPYIYRAYRYPYDYVPQLEKPEETPVERVDCMTFRMPGAAEGMLENITTVPEALGYTSEMAACVTEDDDENAGDLF